MILGSILCLLIEILILIMTDLMSNSVIDLSMLSKKGNLRFYCRNTSVM